MTQYCICATCTGSAAQPAERAQGQMESIQGAQVAMQQGWTLAHWSAADFATMCSTEIHNFQQPGHKLRVGASFYLYQGNAPNVRPQQLRLLGLGGNHRYTIDYAASHGLEIFYKTNAAANPAEVAVILGCGGTITFDQQTRQATGHNVSDRKPIITIV
ncbi:hypothetical protein JR065_18840 [Xanthomonas sp. AmX2]|uniref:hypothetical protein n=1 Tax=Xanthomonas sp. TaxID=29446 RepID=UPI001981B884|nr:hypothetical protein [Xanthomonas sp.]MBN6152400.1 hypothetical protein [Xanthomonas sp.]